MIVQEQVERDRGVGAAAEHPDLHEHAARAPTARGAIS
jgi:hypothetical protein